MWVLLWVFWTPSGTLETYVRMAAVEEVVLSSKSECEAALAKQMNVNDTRFMVSNQGDRLVCVQIPK